MSGRGRYSTFLYGEGRGNRSSEVEVLVDAYQAAGGYDVTFEAGELPSGLYLYRLEAGGEVRTRTMTLMK